MTVAERMRRRLAREFTRHMFTLHCANRPVAASLVLTATDGSRLGGWCAAAFQQQVEHLLDKAAARRLARQRGK